MTRSVYTLCEFQKIKSVGFCVIREFCGKYEYRKYMYRNHKIWRGHYRPIHASGLRRFCSLRSWNCSILSDATAPSDWRVLTF